MTRGDLLVPFVEVKDPSGRTWTVLMVHNYQSLAQSPSITRDQFPFFQIPILLMFLLTPRRSRHWDVMAFPRARENVTIPGQAWKWDRFNSRTEAGLFVSSLAEAIVRGDGPTRVVDQPPSRTPESVAGIVSSTGETKYRLAPPPKTNKSLANIRILDVPYAVWVLCLALPGVFVVFVLPIFDHQIPQNTLWILAVAGSAAGFSILLLTAISRRARRRRHR